MTGTDLVAMIKRHPVGFACGVICVACAALFYFRMDLVEESHAAFSAKSAEATTILANVKNAEKLPSQVAEIQELTKELDGRLLRTGQLAANLQYFYKLEAETEVKLIDVRQGTPLPKSGKSLFIAIPFNVAVQGPFKQVAIFLQKLENGPYFCHFTSVNFARSISSSETPKPGTDPLGTTLTLNLELLGLP